MSKQYLINGKAVLEFDPLTKKVNPIADEIASAAYGEAIKFKEIRNSGALFIKMWIVDGGHVFWDSHTQEYHFSTKRKSLIDWLNDWYGGVETWANCFGFDYPNGGLASKDNDGECFVGFIAHHGEDDCHLLIPKTDTDGDALIFDNYAAAKHYVDQYHDWDYSAYLIK